MANNQRSENMYVPTRVAYPYFFRKRDKYKGADVAFPKFEGAMIIPKIDPFTGQSNQPLHDMLSGQLYNIAVAAYGSWPADLENPLEDGDLDPAKLAKAPWRAQSWVFKAKNYDFVAVADANNNPVEMEMIGAKPAVKSGDWGTACVQIRSSDNANGKRLGFFILGWKIGIEGEAIGGGVIQSAGDLFGAPTGAPAMPVGAPPGMAPPAPAGYPPAAPAGMAPPAPAGYPPAGMAPPAPAGYPPAGMAPPAPAGYPPAAPAGMAPPAPAGHPPAAPAGMAPPAPAGHPPAAPAGMAPPAPAGYPPAGMAPPAPAGYPPAGMAPPAPAGYPPAGMAPPASSGGMVGVPPPPLANAGGAVAPPYPANPIATAPPAGTYPSNPPMGMAPPAPVTSAPAPHMPVMPAGYPAP